MVPNTRFTELLADIEPSATTKGQASNGHNAVRYHLQTQAKFKDRWVNDFLSGSYTRDTSIRPRMVTSAPTLILSSSRITASRTIPRPF